MSRRIRLSVIGLLLLILVVIVATYMVHILLLYDTGRKVFDSEMKVAMDNELRFYMASLESDLSAIREQLFVNLGYTAYAKLAIQWNTLELSELYRMVSDVQYRLYSLRTSSPLVKEVAVYLLSNDKSIGSTYTYKSIDAGEEARIDALLASQWDHNLSFYGEDLHMAVSYPYAYQGQHVKPIFLIVVWLDPEAFEASIAPLSSEPGEVALLTSGERVLARHGTGTIPDAQLLSGEMPEGALITRQSSADMPITILRAVPAEGAFKALAEYNGWFSFAVFTMAAVLAAVLTVLIAYLFRPLRVLNAGMAKVRNGDFSARLPSMRLKEMDALTTGFNQMTEEINRLIEQDYKKTILAQNAQLKQLQYQIDPHFLYNSFFLINSFAEEEDYENLKRLSVLMGAYFKFITRGNQTMVPLTQEAEHAATYARIQAMRFSPRITVTLECVPKRLEALMVQRLIIQPLLENAFLHGVRDRASGGLVRLRYQDEGERLIICVEDNGGALSDGQIDGLQALIDQNDAFGEGVALSNIAQRVALAHPGGRLRVSRSPLGGLMTEIVIPLERGEEEGHS